MSIPREPPSEAPYDHAPPRRPRRITGAVVAALCALSIAAIAADAAIRPSTPADALPLFGGTVLIFAAASDVFIVWYVVRHTTDQTDSTPEDVAISTDIGYRTGHEDGYRAGLQEGLRRAALNNIDNVFNLRRPEPPQPPPGWHDQHGQQDMTKSSPS